MHKVCRTKGFVDGITLQRELEAALGPASSDRWWPVFDPGEAVITYNDELFQREQIESLLQAHVSTAAIAARCSAPASLESLCASDPEVAKIVMVLKLCKLLK